jgi:hypothetical protein
MQRLSLFFVGAAKTASKQALPDLTLLSTTRFFLLFPSLQIASQPPLFFCCPLYPLEYGAPKLIALFPLSQSDLDFS